MPRADRCGDIAPEQTRLSPGNTDVHRCLTSCTPLQQLYVHRLHHLTASARKPLLVLFPQLSNAHQLSAQHLRRLRRGGPRLTRIAASQAECEASPCVAQACCFCRPPLLTATTTHARAGQFKRVAPAPTLAWAAHLKKQRKESR